MITIVTASDRNFLEPLSAFVLSVAATTNNKIRLIILTQDLSATDIEPLVREVSENVELECCNLVGQGINAPAISSLLSERITSTTFLRLFLHLIPDLPDKLLYLDADIIVKADLSALWKHPLQGKIIGAVVDDPSIDRNRKNQWNEFDHFNAGMLLIDVRQWLQKGLDATVTRDFAEGRVYVSELNDQDYLNRLLGGQVYYLDRGFNYQSVRVYNDIRDGKQLPSPYVIHFTGGDKPWLVHSIHPYRHLYLEFQLKSPFQGAIQDLFLDHWDDNLLQQLTAYTGDVLIWGVGERGRRIYHAIKRRFGNIDVQGFVDTYSTLKEYDDLPVYTGLPDGRLDTILVASAEFESAIKKTIRQADTKATVYPEKSRESK